MTQHRKTLLPLVIALSLGGVAYADVLGGLNGAAGAGGQLGSRVGADSLGTLDGRAGGGVAAGGSLRGETSELGQPGPRRRGNGR